LFRAARLVAFGTIGAAALGGCTYYVGYTADVRNETAQPVVATLMLANANGQPTELAGEGLGPGNRGEVVRYNVLNTYHVYLQVDAQGNPGYPAQMDLKPGLTVVKVLQDGNVPYGKLHLDRLDRE
jgi:hypothetical protein